MFLKKKHLIVIGLAATMLTSPLSATEAEDTRLLMEQGYFWLDKNQPAQARDAWNKALRISPGNEEAKNGLALIESLPNIADSGLQQARTLARAAQYSDAVNAYQAVFGNQRPPLTLATEYYETLAATDDGWQEATQALEGLLQQHPSHTRLKLSLAKILTYREATRRRGIQQLETLSRTSGFHEEALAAWKQALTWLESSPGDAPSYTAYLSQAPLDSEIMAQMQRIERDREGDLGKAWQSYDAGNRQQAEKTFRQILKAEPENADALAGLGLLRLEQQRFGDASRLLQKSIDMDASKQNELSRPLATAQYWNLIKQAESARQSGSTARAKALIQRASKLSPSRQEHLQLRAAIESDLGNREDAIRLYREVLRSQPKNRGTQRALVSLLLETGAEAEALNLVKKYGLSQEKFFRDRNRINARQLRSEAAQLAKRGESDLALQTLLRAKNLDNENLWIRHDLALLYLDEGKSELAYSQIDELLADQPLDPELLYARALVSSHEGNDYVGLTTLEQIPEAKRTSNQEELQHRLWRRYQLSRVQQMMTRGDRPAAVTLTERIRQQAGDQSSARMAYASALAITGQQSSAVEAAREALALEPAPPASLELEYASVLLQARETERLDSLLTRLQSQQDSFNNDQQESLQRVSLGRAILKAHELRRSGELAAAYDALRPWLDLYPSDPDVLLTMAALYNDAGDSSRARELYEQVITTQPTALSAWQGAAGAALTEHDYTAAREYVNRGLAQQPGSTDLLALRGIIENLSGNRRAARSDLRTALETEEARQAGNHTADYPLDVVSGAYLRLVDQTASAATLFPYEPWETRKKSHLDTPEWMPQAKQTLAQLDDRINRSAFAGLDIRSHGGSSGLDELSVTRLPLGYSQRLQPDQAWGLEAALVNLDAGGFDKNDIANLAIGTTALDPNYVTNAPGSQDDQGLQLGGWWQQGDWTFDLGTTPLGAEIENVVGGIRWLRQLEGIRVTAALDRRAVEDSLLSWTGTVDPRSGNRWGAVLDNRIALNLSDDRGLFGYYTEASLSVLEGDHVDRNDAYRLAAGVYWKPLNEADRLLTIGSRLQLMGYDLNQRHFSYGHGGYFSPQDYVALTFPLEFKQRKGALRYRLAASIGMYDYREDDAPYYPSDPGLQSTLEATQNLPASFSSFYPDNDDSGFAYDATAEMEYNLNRQLSLNLKLGTSNARDYRDTRAVGYLRYYLSPRKTLQPDLHGNATVPYSLTGDER